MAGSGTGDQVADTVTQLGTDGRDQPQITGSEAANDRLNVNPLEGDDPCGWMPPPSG